MKKIEIFFAMLVLMVCFSSPAMGQEITKPKEGPTVIKFASCEHGATSTTIGKNENHTVHAIVERCKDTGVAPDIQGAAGATSAQGLPGPEGKPGPPGPEGEKGDLGEWPVELAAKYNDTLDVINALAQAEEERNMSSEISSQVDLQEPASQGAPPINWGLKPESGTSGSDRKACFRSSWGSWMRGIAGGVLAYHVIRHDITAGWISFGAAAFTWKWEDIFGSSSQPSWKNKLVDLGCGAILGGLTMWGENARSDHKWGHSAVSAPAPIVATPAPAPAEPTPEPTAPISTVVIDVVVPPNGGATVEVTTVAAPSTVVPVAVVNILPPPADPDPAPDPGPTPVIGTPFLDGGNGVK